MKARIRKFKTFIEQNIWADFLFVFTVYITIQLVSNYMKSDAKPIGELLLPSLFFTVIFVPIIRMLRPNEEGLGLYIMVDHVRHYQVGQRPQLKSFLESKGYLTDYNKGSISYFKSKKDSVFTTQKTFIHETEHWVALVAPPEVLNQVPASIISIYPQKR